MYNMEGFGDLPEPVLRCGADSDLWQVGTSLFEKEKRYYRVRWRQPWTFSMVAVSKQPFPDCTVRDARADVHPPLLTAQ
jgi:hypothetical protein